MAKPPKPKRPAKPKAKKDRRGTPKGKGTRSGPHGGRIGNPPFVPTEEQRQKVLTLFPVIPDQSIIAEELGISVDTLQRHFRKELDQALPRANARVGATLYKGALAGDAKKIDMWFERRGGPDWAKKTRIEHSGPNGGPMEYTDLSDEELDARIIARLADLPPQH